MRKTKNLFWKLCVLAVVLILAVAMFTACNNSKSDDDDYGNNKTNVDDPNGDNNNEENGGETAVSVKYTAPSASSITAQQAKTAVNPALVAIAAALDVDVTVATDAMDDKSELIQLLLREAGITEAMLNKVVAAAMPTINDIVAPILELVQTQITLEDVKTFITEANIRTVEKSISDILDAIPVNNMIALVGAAVKYSAYLTSGEDLTYSEYVSLKSDQGIDVDVEYENSLAFYATKIYCSDETAFILTQVISALKSAMSYSAAEQARLATTVCNMIPSINTGNYANLISRDTIPAVNILGNIILKGVEGLGDGETYHNIASALIEKITKFSGSTLEMGSTYSKYIYEAITYPELFGLVGGVMANISLDVALDIYSEFSGFSPNGNYIGMDDEATGRFVATVAAVIAPQYKKLSQYTLDYIDEVATELGYSGSTKLTKYVSTIITKSTAKDVDDMTSVELTAIANAFDSIVENIGEEDEDAPEFRCYETLLLPNNATKDQIIEEIERVGYSVRNRNYYDGYYDEIDLDDLTYTLKADKNYVLVTGEGIKDSKIPVFIYRSTTKLTATAHGEVWIAKGTRADDAKEIVLEDIWVTIKALNPSTYATATVSFDSDDMTISGLDTRTTGTKYATVTIDTVIGRTQVSFSYYVYDPNELRVTGISVYVDDEIPVGTTEAQIRNYLSVKVNYDNGNYDFINDYTISGYTVPTTGGTYRFTVAYGGYTQSVSFYVAEQVNDAMADAIAEAISSLGSFYDGEFNKIQNALNTNGKATLIGEIALTIGRDDLGVSLVIAVDQGKPAFKLMISDADIFRYKDGRLLVADVGMDLEALKTNMDAMLVEMMKQLMTAIDKFNLEATALSISSSLMNIGSALGTIFDLEEENSGYTFTISGSTINTIIIPMLRSLLGQDFNNAIEQIQGVAEAIGLGDRFEHLLAGNVSLSIHVDGGVIGLTLLDSTDNQRIALNAGMKVITGSLTGTNAKYNVGNITDSQLKDIVMTVPLNLGYKGIGSTTTINIHTSDMFASTGNDFFTITTNVNAENDINNAFKFVFNDNYLYADFSGLFEALDADSTYSTTYKFDVRSELENKSIVQAMNESFAAITREMRNPSHSIAEMASDASPMVDEDTMRYLVKFFPGLNNIRTPEDLLEYLGSILGDVSSFVENYFELNARESEITIDHMPLIDENITTENGTLINVLGKYISIPSYDCYKLSPGNWTMEPCSTLNNWLWILSDALGETPTPIYKIFGVEYDSLLTNLYLDAVVEKRSFTVALTSRNNNTYIQSGLTVAFVADGNHLNVTQNQLNDATSFEETGSYDVYFQGEHTNIGYTVEAMFCELMQEFLEYKINQDY